MNNEELQKALQELVKARLSVLPEDATLSVGSSGDYSRNDLIKEVSNNSEIGKKFIEMEVEYIKLLKEGIYYEFPSAN